MTTAVPMMARIGIDVGGTFTDLVAAVPERGLVVHHKEPSTPADPSRAVADGLAAILAQADLRPEEIGGITHGTTIGLNAIIQRRGARIALVVTEGYRDILEIGRSRMPSSFDLYAGKEEPLVPRDRIVEIAARLGPGGVPVSAPDAGELDRVAARLRATGADAAAVLVLHGYTDPAFEEGVASGLRERLPDLPLMASATVWPEVREYERALVACLNAYIQPLMRDYFGRLESRVRALGVPAPIFISASNGGSMSLRSAAERPIETVLSGPAAGVTAAARLGMGAIVTFDMGGTSSDIAVTVNGSPELATHTTVGGLPLIVPVVAVSAIGAGGGSVVWVDGQGVLKVGPESAGADPGPVAYGRGGERPAVTDCYLVTGMIDPATFLGGRMRLDADAAAKSLADIATRLSGTLPHSHPDAELGSDPDSHLHTRPDPDVQARPDTHPGAHPGSRLGAGTGLRPSTKLGTGPDKGPGAGPGAGHSAEDSGAEAAHRAAAGALRVATAGMATELQKIMAQCGLDPRRFTLVPFGGAGPTHAAMLAEEVGITHIVVPPTAATFCALGAAGADLRRDFARSLRRRLDPASAARLSGVLADLSDQAQAWLTEQSAAGAGFAAAPGTGRTEDDRARDGETGDGSAGDGRTGNNGAGDGHTGNNGAGDGHTGDSRAGHGAAPEDAAARSGRGFGARLSHSADMRYAGQAYELSVALDPARLDVGAISEAFHAEHERLYGFRDQHAPIELGTARLGVVGPVAELPSATVPPGTGSPAPHGRRQVLLAGAWHAADVHLRAALGVGDAFAGPAIVEQDDTTVVVPPGWSGNVDGTGNLHLRRSRKG